MAKFAKIFAHENRAAVILSVLDSLESVASSDAWPSEVSKANRLNHLRFLRGFLTVDRPDKNKDALYSLEPDDRARLQLVVEALETFADGAEAKTAPTLRVSFDDDGVCVLQTPQGRTRVERSKLLGALAVALEFLPEK